MSDLQSQGSSPAVTGGSPAAASGNEGASPNAQAEGKLTADTKFTSMGEFQKKQPKLFNMMMQGIATNIVNEMRDHQERLKELMRKAERDASGR